MTNFQTPTLEKALYTQAANTNPVDALRTYLTFRTSFLNTIKPLVQQAYEDGAFYNVVTMIKRQASIEGSIFPEFANNSDDFVEWINGMLHESLLIVSSGSYWMALCDADNFEDFFFEIDEDNAEGNKLWDELRNTLQNLRAKY
jgi:hypothetical protein